jgi:hypothetical protein
MKQEKRKIIWLAVCGILLLILTLLFCKSEVTMAGNESSRFAVVHAFGEQGTFAIDKTAFKSVDKKLINGHLYSDKPLLPSFIFGLVHKVFYLLTGLSFFTHYHLCVYALNLLCIGSLNILLFWLFFRKLDTESEAPLWSKLLFSFSLIASTWLFSYGVSMNNHTPAALLLFGLYCALDTGPKELSLQRCFWGGILAGVLFNFEIPVGGIFGIVAFLTVCLIAKERRVEKAALYAVGGVLPILFMFILNYAAYGSFLPVYMIKGGTYSPGVTDKNYFTYLWDVILGTRGLFSYMPALLFIFPALIICRKIGRDKISWLFLGGVLSVVIFYWIMTNEYGGWAYGFRYLIPIIPIIWYFVARVFAERVKKWYFGVLCFCMLWGVVTSVTGAYNPWCACYEGFRSPPGEVDHVVRNTFAANLLTLSYEHWPESVLTRFLVNDLYGPRTAYLYLWESNFNNKNIPVLARLKPELDKLSRSLQRKKTK